MFGYVTINRQELKVKDLELYEAYYCGLCKETRSHLGAFEALSLSYDMTFLSILLSGLYEEKRVALKEPCLPHPLTKRKMILSEVQEYAADMNLMLAYHNRMDDWLDEKEITARILGSIYHKKYKELAIRYPRQHKAIVNYIKKLHKSEKSNLQDLEYAANLTGEMLAEIYVWKEDMWQDSLRHMGYYMGKFIYLMDAYEDIEKDKKSGSYNPFTQLYEENLLEQRAEEYLKLMMGGCCQAFETLPIIRNADLLRNILYSGIWTKFAQIAKKRRQEQKTEGN